MPSALSIGFGCRWTAGTAAQARKDLLMAVSILDFINEKKNLALWPRPSYASAE